MFTRVLNELIARDRIGESTISNRSPNSSQRVVSSLNLCQIASALTDTGLIPRSRLVITNMPSFYRKSRSVATRDVDACISFRRELTTAGYLPWSKS